MTVLGAEQRAKGPSVSSPILCGILLPTPTAEQAALQSQANPSRSQPVVKVFQELGSQVIRTAREKPVRILKH
jgi:hypothetical protein